MASFSVWSPLAAQTHDVTAVGYTLVGDRLGKGLEHTQRVETRLAAGHENFEILVELVVLVDDVGEELSVGLERAGEPNVSKVRRLAGAKFQGDYAQSLGNGGISLNIRNSVVSVKGRRLNHTLGIFDSGIEDGTTGDSREICPVDDAARVLVLGNVGGKVDEGVNHSRT
ncbi:hypothetical protein HG531_005467 [Fusarium graminearum]|nr:hypothetical protein HG531_005467 [Fusarium graminearum]